MHLHVDVYVGKDVGDCTRCQESGLVWRLVIALGTGTNETSYLCDRCFTRDRHSVDVEQADLKPARQPPSRADKKLSRKLEHKLAEDIGGRRQPGSGNQDHAKGDVRKKGELRLEHKFTRAKQYTLKREELDKINSECGFGEKPVFLVDFLNPTTGKVEDTWATIPYADWKESFDASRKDK